MSAASNAGTVLLIGGGCGLLYLAFVRPGGLTQVIADVTGVPPALVQAATGNNDNPITQAANAASAAGKSAHDALCAAGVPLPNCPSTSNQITPYPSMPTNASQCANGTVWYAPTGECLLPSAIPACSSGQVRSAGGQCVPAGVQAGGGGPWAAGQAGGYLAMLPTGQFVASRDRLGAVAW